MTWPNYSPSCRKAVDELLRAGGSLSAYRANKDYGAGPTEGSYAYKLEREIERKFKVKHAVAVNSGTAALHCALSALDCGRVDRGEIITSPYTFSATVSSILLAGFTPRFADVNPDTYCITKETVKRVITKRTKAILPVHLFGGMADMQGLGAFGLPIIEDACQAVGAVADKKQSGGIGLAGVYSFNGSKNVPAGESGALTSNSADIAESCRLLMNHGENFGASGVGYNYRPNELTCCVAYHGLLELDERNNRRQELAATFYGTEIRRDHVYYCTPFKSPIKDRAKFIKRMSAKGVYIGGGYINPPLHHYKAFRKYATRELPVVDDLSFRSLCLIYDFTPDKPIEYAHEVRRKVYEAVSE